MRKKIMLVVVAMLLALMGTALARSGVYKGKKIKRTVIDFSDVTIQGELVKPDGSYLVNRKRTKFSQLIQTRQNFNPELFNSTDMF